MPDEKQTPPAPEWNYKEEFGIVSQLKQVVQATQKASELELAELRRKLERLTYGS
jgi:hypothetical protein